MSARVAVRVVNGWFPGTWATRRVDDLFKKSVGVCGTLWGKVGFRTVGRLLPPPTPKFFFVLFHFIFCAISFVGIPFCQFPSTPKGVRQWGRMGGREKEESPSIKSLTGFGVGRPTRNVLCFRWLNKKEDGLFQQPKPSPPERIWKLKNY